VPRLASAFTPPQLDDFAEPGLAQRGLGLNTKRMVERRSQLSSVAGLIAASLLLVLPSACGPDERAANGGSGAAGEGAGAGAPSSAGGGGGTDGSQSGATSDGGALDGGTANGGAANGGTANGGTANGGAANGGAATGDGAASGAHGEGGFGGSADGGAPGGDEPDLEALFEHGEVTASTTARPTFGAILVANDGERIYAVESRRDVEPGPFGLPWRSRFRLAAYDQGAFAWAFDAEPDDVVSDVVVHPSGDITIAVLHHPLARLAYDLVRLDPNGVLLSITTLTDPSTAPDSDFASSDPHPYFGMKSDFADATVGGWLRLLADGEGLVATFLSYLDVPETHPLSRRFALGLETLTWQQNRYVERWARVVEGPHGAQPAAWTYDELRWMEQAIRPFLARDDSTGDIVVGRAWNSLRCQANVAVFAEFSAAECVLGAVSPIENERLPLAVTRFDSAGARLGTTILAPDPDAAEQVAFALGARDGNLAVVGAVVRRLANGKSRTYPDPSGYVDYDGYIAIYGAAGQPLLHHDFNLGRGDVLAAMRWTAGGIVAVGAAGWDRWQGGMSISRGADPLFAWLSPDGERARARVIPMSDGSRHFNLHDVALLGRSIVAHGFSDAPMTHSADGGNDAARTFGALRVELSEP
jgi:hypothetical protein